MDKTILELDPLLEYLGSEYFGVENDVDNWKIPIFHLKSQVLDLGSKNADFAIDLSHNSRQSVFIGSNLRINLENVPTLYSSTIILNITALANINLDWDSALGESNWEDGRVLSQMVSGETYILSLTTNGPNKNNIFISWNYKKVNQFLELIDANTVSWDTKTGLNKNLTTARENITLEFSNHTNGMVGQLNLISSGNPLSLTLPSGSELIGRFVNLSPGEYVIYWSFDGVKFRFINFKSTGIGSIISGDETKLQIEEVNGVVTITLLEGGIEHQNIEGAGTKTHEDIDTHIDSTENPHTTTLEQAALAGNKIGKELHIGTSSEGFKIKYIADPVDAQDAATKSFVEAIAQGLKLRPEVDVATTEALDVTPQGSGPGKTLTFNTNGAKSIDTVTLALGRRVLNMHSTPASHNGVYVVTDAGSASTPVILTRAEDADGDPSWEVTVGSYHFVRFGDTMKNTGWAISGTGTIIVDTDPINFYQFSGAGSYTGVNGVKQEGTQFSFDAEEAADDNTEKGSQNHKIRVKNYTAVDNTTVLRQEKQTNINLSVGNNEITHLLGVKEVSVVVYDEADDSEVELGVKPISTTRVDLYTDIAFTATILIKG